MPVGETENEQLSRVVSMVQVNWTWPHHVTHMAGEGMGAWSRCLHVKEMPAEKRDVMNGAARP